MARKRCIIWDIKVSGTAYGHSEGIKVGDAWEVGRDISEEQALLRVAHGQAHFDDEKPMAQGYENPRYAYVLEEHRARTLATSAASSGR